MPCDMKKLKKIAPVGMEPAVHWTQKKTVHTTTPSNFTQTRLNSYYQVKIYG